MQNVILALDKTKCIGLGFFLVCLKILSLNEAEREVLRWKVVLWLV